MATHLDKQTIILKDGKLDMNVVAYSHRIRSCYPWSTPGNNVTLKLTEVGRLGGSVR